MAKTVIGLLQDPAEARDVIQELLASGVRKKHIGVITPDDRSDAQFAAAARAVTRDMAKGAVTGTIAGLVLAASTMMIPGFGPLLAGGPAATLVAGAAYGGLGGSVIGALMSKGLPEDQANFYADGLRRGGTLITVHADDDDQIERAVRVLKRHGATDLDVRVGGDPRTVGVHNVVIPLPERRASNQPYSGEERRQAA